ncbi:MAG: hypothetical protein BMS9Abin39_0199 [Ignavibacteria bacterium]|nr:MAG: hypothetical protein BMS9Abin39_0199 [Ignavibacteria bacterium]
MRKGYILTLTVLILFFNAFSIFAQEWGTIRYVHSTTNIRAGRSTESRIVGQLKAGQKIIADFLKDNWYAVFSVEESVRDESKSLGYIYAPLLKPNPLESTKLSRKSTEILKYKIVNREDVSYGGTPRMVFRIVVNVNRIPSEDQLKKTAKHIWENGNKGWEEFTVFMYLPDMDIKNIAYGVGEFRPNGLKEFKIQNYALYGTKWQ